MMNSANSDRTVPVQFVRGTRAFKQFKNPPQPHMCIQDTIKNSNEHLYINVLGWQKIANPKQYSDPIPLYGGMQVPQGCGPNSTKPPLIVFAVMVNPEILKINGKNAANPLERDALVSLLCDFVEAMNPGLQLARNPVIMKDRDLAGELKDVWLAVQTKREREKGVNQDVSYKVYSLDEPRPNYHEQLKEDDINSYNNDNKYNDTEFQFNNRLDNNKFGSNIITKSSTQILKNAGQKSEFDSGMNNYQLNQQSATFRTYHSETVNREIQSSFMGPMSYGNTLNSANPIDNTICTPVYGQIMSTRENHIEVGDVHQSYALLESLKQDNKFRKDLQVNQHKNTTGSTGWDQFSKCDLPTTDNGEGSCLNSNLHRIPQKNGTLDENATSKREQYNFFPIFQSNGSSHKKEAGKSVPESELQVKVPSTAPSPVKNQDKQHYTKQNGKKVENSTAQEPKESPDKKLTNTLEKLALNTGEDKSCLKKMEKLKKKIS